MSVVSLGPVYGKVLSRGENLGLRAWEFRYAPGQIIPRHEHAHPYLCFLLHGDVHETNGSLDLTYSRERLVFLPEGATHDGKAGPEGAYFIGVEFRTSAMDSRFDEFTLPNSLVRVQERSLRLRLHAALLEMRGQQAGFTEEAWPFELMSYLGGRPITETPCWLERIRGYVEDSFADPLRISDLAKVAERNPAHMMRAFRKQTGQTIGAHIQNVRVDAAIRKLRFSNASLAAVAQSCGFSDQSHLSRVLKTAFGLSPGALRRRLRES